MGETERWSLETVRQCPTSSSCDSRGQKVAAGPCPSPLQPPHPCVEMPRWGLTHAGSVWPHQKAAQVNNTEISEGKRQAEPEAGHRRLHEVVLLGIHTWASTESGLCLIWTKRHGAGCLTNLCFNFLICKMGWTGLLVCIRIWHKVSIYQMVGVIITSKVSLTEDTETLKVLTAWWASHLDLTRDFLQVLTPHVLLHVVSHKLLTQGINTVSLNIILLSGTSPPPKFHSGRLPVRS